MDNELKVFLQSFTELENLFQALPIPLMELQSLKELVAGFQQNAKDLALYDAITHAFSARASKWLISNEQIIGMAKLDVYDLRQANKVYGALVVDGELRKLAFQLMSIFTLENGDFVGRSPGSDEFRISSTAKSPRTLKRLLQKLYLKQEQESLLTWDFGVGLTETESEDALQKQRRTFRPMVLRQTLLESHSEIPRRIEDSNGNQSWHEFNMPYQRLVDKIQALQLSPKLEQQAIEQVQITKAIVENIVTREVLTGVLNGLGAKWYLEQAAVKSIVLTDMLNMHEGNNRYGSAAIDQDLKRFSNMLIKHFPKNEGFLIFRSERAGDEFKITSTKSGVEELQDRVERVWQEDLNHGLLAWNYGAGQNDSEAHVDLYKNRLKEAERMNRSTLDGKSTFIIVRPENEAYSNLFKLSEEMAQAAGGTPIIDLHLTIQAIRNVEDFETLKARLQEYASTVQPFEIKVKNVARMNVNNHQGRLWLLADRNLDLEKMYNDLSCIAMDVGCESYPYKAQNWLPHIKIVDFPENKSTQIKDPTFGTRNNLTFTVRRFEWTVQTEPERWDLLQQFSFSE